MNGKSQLVDDFKEIRKLMPNVEKNLNTYNELNILHLERATSTFLTTLRNIGKFQLVKKELIKK